MSRSDQAIQPTPAGKISLTLREQDFACRGWAHHERRIPCQIWKRPFANVPTTSGSPMVNPRARRTYIGSVLKAKLSRPQLKAQAATLPPPLPPTRDWLRRNPLKRQRSPDPGKAKPAPHSSMRASSRGPRDDDSVTSVGGILVPPLFVETSRGRLSGLARSAGCERMPPDWKPPHSITTSAGRHNPTA